MCSVFRGVPRMLRGSLSRTLAKRPETVLKGQLKLMRSYNRAVPYKEPQWNELPVPQGSWERMYQKKNRKYNLQLIVGLTMFSFSLLVYFTSGIVTFNASVPKLDSGSLDFGDADPCKPKPKC